MDLISYPHIWCLRQADIFNMSAGLNDSDIYLERVTVTPNPLSTFGTADSDFGFTEEIVMVNDSSV